CDGRHATLRHRRQSARSTSHVESGVPRSRWRQKMRWMLLAALSLALSLNLSVASAQETCESKAVSKEGKPLAGAAKTSFLKKCKRDTCQVKAVGSNGRALAGAAKKSFMQKCQR